MIKEDNFYKKPRPGHTLFMRSTQRYASPHCHALYLGRDSTGEKVLLPTFVDGFSIVSLDAIDGDSWKTSGKFNIRSEKLDGSGEPSSYEYVFFDTERGTTVRERVVSVRKIEDRWVIVSLPDSPTWTETKN